MESFLSRVATLKCLLAFLSCTSTVLGERVKNVNKIRLSVFLLAAGQILKGKVGWGKAAKMAIKFARDTFQPSTGQTYFIPPISKQRNSCSPKNCSCRYWILERGPALICCEQRPITKSLRLTLCVSQSKADKWTNLLLSKTIVLDCPARALVCLFGMSSM